MNDVIDAWSEHIYWNYWDHFRMEQRLKDVAYLVRTELPASARKPTFVMEYGVRGTNTCGTKVEVTAAYYQDAACTELRRMSLAGLPQALVHDRFGTARVRSRRQLGSLLGRSTTARRTTSRIG